MVPGLLKGINAKMNRNSVLSSSQQQLESSGVGKEQIQYQTASESTSQDKICFGVNKTLPELMVIFFSIYEQPHFLHSSFIIKVFPITLAFHLRAKT